MAFKFSKTPPNKKTHGEFLADVENKYGVNHEYRFLTNYKGTDYDIKIKHNKCEHEWETTPNRFLNPKNKEGEPCPVCRKEKEELRKSIEENSIVKDEIKNTLGNEYELLGEYIDKDTPIKIKHNTQNCGHEYSILISNLSDKNKSTCLICTIQEKAMDFIRNVYNLEGHDYAVICEFNGNDVGFKVRHNKCGSEFETTSEKFINEGKRCVNPRCKKGTNKYNFRDKVFDKYGDEFLVIDDYIDSNTEIQIKHNIEDCGRTYYRVPKHFLSGKGVCPFCRKNSKNEAKITDILNSKNIKFKRQFTFDGCTDNSLLRFDFAILNNFNNVKYLIEYDGQQHFKPVDFANKGEDWAKEQFEITKKRDQIKNDYCKDNDILLYRIPYWKKDNIEEILNKLIHNEHVEIDDRFLVK